MSGSLTQRHCLSQFSIITDVEREIIYKTTQKEADDIFLARTKDNLTLVEVSFCNGHLCYDNLACRSGISAFYLAVTILICLLLY